ncbi:glutamate synthase subunit beta [Heyndrickxia oleronia]|uniref:Glutamate synthase n=1 Tax=Heyndrickxia oleronia TaxID=38875 RepID=A0A8E2IB19_9BACI|nr:glutamate synthase subunit beta [Heyndrickxia oleronia]OJH20068.1 glutamate synthase [Bacillus obstructivus]MCM3457410.1 glutamate synthase subunit beta [Heyndrickxia oleronia]MEC1377411.1 glutamate synthase subunit beta [Heyndrickxia oleronia]OOP69582.1 glutamate synthase [Heyndrickxia oleronia]QQZ03925.1 glutamate synthase subunit beta [Heyndrickxia oleronia]
MSQSTEFIDIKRRNAKERPPVERVNDWSEYQQPFTEKKLKQQASRCMDCGTPFCQMGTILSTGTSGCPLYNLIPEWNMLVHQGKWYEAFQRLAKTNNFPEFTARACPAPCEGSCTAGVPSEPVTIKSIEKAIIDRAFLEGWVKPRKPLRKTGHKIAVIGSGPAGLTAADDLNQLGHSVTVFEREDRFGGLLMYGIPNMKIDKKYVERRIELLKQEGIEFRANIHVGIDLSIEELQQNFDTVLLCIGAEQPRELPIEGRHLKGIYHAMDYLMTSTKHYLDPDVSCDINAEGKKVIVIGGGDTGADCVATAIRQGCKSVVQFGKHGQLPLERQPGNPWPENPAIFSLDYAYEEALTIFGEDPRQYFIQTQSFVGNDQDEVIGLRTVSFQPNTALDQTENYWDADLVLIAIGFEGVKEDIFPTIQRSQKRIATVTNSFQTSQDGVFAAGDARRGQSLIVWAIQEGKKAAIEIDRYLASKEIKQTV